MNLSRRSALKKSIMVGGALFTGSHFTYAKTLMSLDQAKKVLCPGKSMKKVSITLTKEQGKSIQKAAKVRVRNLTLNAWKTSDGGWFLVDQVYGKHEFIDYAIALSSSGTVKGIEVLTYRESYGDQIKHPKWRAQFHGKGVNNTLKIDKDIKNISGATLSCVHITEGTRRILHTWQQILRRY